MRLSNPGWPLQGTAGCQRELGDCSVGREGTVHKSESGRREHGPPSLSAGQERRLLGGFTGSALQPNLAPTTYLMSFGV